MSANKNTKLPEAGSQAQNIQSSQVEPQRENTNAAIKAQSNVAEESSPHPNIVMLRSRPFIIKTFQFKLDRDVSRNDESRDDQGSQEGYVVETGSILSQTLDKTVLSGPNKDATLLTLAFLRKITPGMSAFSRIHRFCTASGTIIRDETIALADYLSLEPSTEQSETEPDASTHQPTSEPKDKKATKEVAQTKEGGHDSGSTNATGIASGSAGSGTTKAASHATNTIKIFFKSPTYLTASQANAQEVSEDTKSVQQQNQQSENAPPAAKAEIQRPNITSLIPADEGPMASADLKIAATLSEKEWGTVLRNSAVFYGWIINPRNSRVVRASRPAFQLRSKVDLDPVSKIPDFVPAPPTKQRDTTEDSTSESDTETPASERSETEPDNKQPIVTQSSTVAGSQGKLADAIPSFEEKPDKGIPNFRTNDDSKIEITVCRHELMLAMAKNDFSSESTEATASGGAAGITVSASVGMAKSSEHSQSTSSTSVQQVMVARYLFPRCDLLLYPEDLEPTPEFALLLNTVRTTKSIQALRKIHALYGTHFCQTLTLGARLMTTKVLKYDANTSEEEAKQSLRASVGLSVSTPYGGGGVKHEHEERSSESHAREESTQRESVVFEACGGDTILANNPNAWAGTVANPDLWRVISRDALSPMVDILSQMSGFTEVRSWFIQAIPVLTKYLVLDESRSTIVRLRLTAPSNSLSTFNDGRAGFYLGHGIGSMVTPRLNGISTPSITALGNSNFWFRLDYVNDKYLFEPQTYHAPVIQGFPNYKVGSSMFGAKYNDEFAQTVWRFSCPFGEELLNGSRIVIETCPFTNPEAAAGSSTTGAVSHITVFRNAQGVFLPGMSDSDELQYWRVQKVGSSIPGEHIQTNDEIRLCWVFSDQTTGFRDFKDDCFGRRRNQCPPELEGTVLHLKMPWPRFERSDTPNALIMSSNPSEGLEPVLITPAQSARPLLYFLQEVKFRIDAVANGVYGDTEDYLLRDVKQQGDRKNLVRIALGGVTRDRRLHYAVATFGLPP